MKYQIPYRGTIIEVEGIEPFKTDTDVGHFGIIKPEFLSEEYRDLTHIFGKLSGKALVNDMIGQSYSVESLREGLSRWEKYDFYKGSIDKILCYIESEEELQKLTALVNAEYEQSYLNGWVAKMAKEVYDIDIPNDFSLMSADKLGNLPLDKIILQIIVSEYMGLDYEKNRTMTSEELRAHIKSEFKIR